MCTHLIYIYMCVYTCWHIQCAHTSLCEEFPVGDFVYKFERKLWQNLLFNFLFLNHSREFSRHTLSSVLMDYLWQIGRIKRGTISGFVEHKASSQPILLSLWYWYYINVFRIMFSCMCFDARWLFNH